MATPFPFVAGSVLEAAELNAITELPVSTKTDDYTLVAGDAGDRVVANKATAITFTVPNNVFTASQVVMIHNIGAGTLTVAAGAGVTLNGLTLSVLQWQSAILYATSASSFILWPSGGSVKTTKVDAFTTSGTFTPAAGVTYAIAHIVGGGGGVGASAGAGGNSSVAFAGGTITGTGGNAGTASLTNVGATPTSTAGVANSGQGAFGSTFRGADVSDSRIAYGGNGAHVVAGGAVTPGSGITVTVGAGGTAGTNGAAGGSGYVWIEYQV